MKKLELGQRKVISDFLSNVAVAWFTAGVISPFFIRPKNVIEFFISFIVSLIMSYFSLRGALRMAKKKL